MLTNVSDEAPAKIIAKNLSIQRLSPSDENIYGR
jgi:hypothetical protein